MPLRDGDSQARSAFVEDLLQGSYFLLHVIRQFDEFLPRLLGLDLFPPAVARDEIAGYLKRQNRYGLPLDSRRTYTKNDWILWTATMAERAEDRAALIAPILTWLAEAPDREPMTDWYDTVSGKQQGFQARSVVGGFFMPALAASAAFSRRAAAAG